jgi:hypothetical protein
MIHQVSGTADLYTLDPDIAADAVTAGGYANYLAT